MTVNDIQEVIYLTADLVAQTRIGQLNLSDTFKATIIDATRANEGRYKVKNDNITYEVNGAIDAYKKDEQVIIQQPSNDETRIIVGKANEVDQVRPMVYISPKESIIPSLELKTWDENKSAEVGKSQSSLYNVMYVKGEFRKPNLDEDGGIQIILTDTEGNTADDYYFTTNDMLGNYTGKQENWFPQECLFKLTDEQSLDLGALQKVRWMDLLDGEQSARNIEITLGFLSNTYENNTLHIYCDQYPFTFEGPLWEYNGKYYTWNQAHDEGVLRPSFYLVDNNAEENLARNFELVYYNTSEEGKYIGFETEEFDQSGAAQLAANFLPEPTVEDNAQYLNLGNTKSLRKSATALNSGTEVEELSLEWDLSKILQYPEKEFELNFAGSVAQANGCKIQFTLESGDNSKEELYSSTASKDIFSYGFKNIIEYNNNAVVFTTKNENAEEIPHSVEIVDGSLKLVLKLTKAEANDIGNPSVSITQASVGLANKLYSLVWLSNQYDGTWKEIIPANGNYLKPQFDLDPRFSQNQIKANLYISSDTPIESNVITFTQTTDAGEALANPAAVEIEVVHGENSQDSYTCYDDYGAITESSEAWRNRKVSFSLKGLNGYVVDDKTFLWGKKVYWGIPTNMTMIEIGSNESLKAVEFLPTGVPEGYAYYCDKQYMTESVPKTIAYSTFNYKIKDQFIPHHNNNTIICIIEDINGYTYQDTISFGFSESGNYGTDYTLVVREENGYPAYSENLTNYNLIAELYNPQGKKINDAEIDGTYKNLPGAPFVCEANTTVSWGGEENTGRTVKLNKKYPVAWAYTPSDDKRYYYQGPSSIVYDHTGQAPRYWDKEIKLENFTGPNGYSVGISSYTWGDEGLTIKPPSTSYKGYSIKSFDDNSSALIAPPFYIPLDENLCIIISSNTGGGNGPSAYRWIQPLIIRQERHYYDVLNDWDGNLSIDNEHNRIMAAAYAAGTMVDDNTFTGVLMGEKQKFEQKDGDIIPGVKTTGLFGYRDGAETFALRTNGTLKIGNSAGGTINFDDNGLKIDVSNFNLSTNNLKLNSNPLEGEYYFYCGNSNNNISFDKNSKLKIDLKNAEASIDVASGGNLNIANGGNLSIATGGKFTIESKNFNIDTDGSVSMTGILNAGGWTLGGGKIVSDKFNNASDNFIGFLTPLEIASSGAGSDVFLVRIGKDDKFRINSDGTVLCKKLDAQGGTIGGWAIGGQGLYYMGNNEYTDSNSTFKVMAPTPSSGDNFEVIKVGNNMFRVFKSGHVVAQSLELAGNLKVSGNGDAATTITNLVTNSILITSNNIADGAITTNKILSGAVTAVQIADGTITANEIAAGTITANEIAAGAITANKIAAGAITANKIAANTITSDQLSATALYGQKLSGNYGYIGGWELTTNKLLGTSTFTIGRNTGSQTLELTTSGVKITEFIYNGVPQSGVMNIYWWQLAKLASTVSL